MTKISVIVPVYNTEKYLKKCIDSILSQQLEDIELILVDDNSSDNSLEIMKNYEKNDNRVKTIHLEEHKGIGHARNIGIDNANGRYIGFVDSDDYINPKMYRELFFGAERNDVEIARCDKTNIRLGIDYKKIYRKKNPKKSEIIKPERTPYYLIRESCDCYNKIYKHDFIKDFRFIEDIKYEDYPFSIEAVGVAKRIFSLNRPLYYYRIRNDSKSGEESKIIDINTLDIFRCNDEIEKFYLKNGILSIYKDALRDLFIIHSIHHCYPMLKTNIPLSIKKKIINYYMRYVELSYGDLKTNRAYQLKKEITPMFRIEMNFIENMILSSSYNELTNKEEVFDNMKKLILENSRRK